MVFEVAPLNPIRFSGMMTYDFEHTDPKCYWQKFNSSDSTRLQILSDVSDISLTVHDHQTDSLVHTFSVSEIETSLVGQTFKVYESTLSWSSVGEGRYYLKLESSVGIFYSTPIWIAENHEDTLLFRYRNSENNFSVVFDTDIIFTLRVEGDIQNFTPRFDDEIYNDQKRNASKLSSIPFRVWTLFIGSAQGLPDWLTDKVNRVMSCDMIEIDGDYFEKVPEAEWEVIRQEDYPFSGLQIEIMPTNNLYLQRLKFKTDDPDDDMANKVILRRSENRWNISGDIEVSGIFKSRTVLIYLRILRRSGPFTFKIGITPNGNEIGEFETIEECGTYQVRYPFDSVETVYVSGLGLDSDVSLIYEQLDETGGGDGGTIPPAPATAPVGAIWMYERPILDFEQDFNLVTGLGRTGTPYQGWAICNGQNGTIDMRESIPIGWSDENSSYEIIGQEIGQNEKNIPLSALPAHSHRIASDRVGVLAGNMIGTGGRGGSWDNGASGIAKGSQGNGQAKLVNATDSYGAGSPFNVMQKSKVVVFIKKIN